MIETMTRPATVSLRVSMYVHSHAVAEDVVAIYHPFGHEVTFLPSHVWNAVTAGRYDVVPPHILQDLIVRRFLVEPGDDERSLDTISVAPIKGFINLWLLVVQTCNMGCTYCVVEADDQTKNLPKLPVLS